ncbi:hypothetical protein [Fodinibius sp.]|uniref:hypothetical protein n=1 Tax=Fodinibius sp. TaxID=1872440 RepID=UPI002ACDD2AC|nr:hypothetical protein [Fodinibius sp.]MDZ7660458.1 hypothetical protein [Fodinibius sp.]
MAETSEHINDSTIEQPKGGATKATRGRPPAEFYSNSMHGQPSFSVAGNYYHERCLQLEGQLNDANRKNQQITDELFQARKDLSQDKTELLLAHQNEIARLKEESRDKVDGLKETYQTKISVLEKEIEQLDREQFKKDLEYQTSQQSPGNQLTEHFLKKAPDLIDTFGGVISIIAGQRHGLGPFGMTSTPDVNTSHTFETHPSETSESTADEEDSIHQGPTESQDTAPKKQQSKNLENSNTGQ